MQTKNYQVPNFIGVIYRKTSSQLLAAGIDLQRFNRYCLAVLLFYLKKFQDRIPNLLFSSADDEALSRLCESGRFSTEEDYGVESLLLIGLSPDRSKQKEIVGKIERLVNYFSQYEVLKDYSDDPAFMSEYDTACRDLEFLRSEFRLPARFKYNKTKRRDNPFFRGGIEVILPPKNSELSDDVENFQTL